MIEPPSSREKEPTIHRIILGGDITKGEVSQLFVPGGWWKASEIPEEDRLLLEAADAGTELKERIGCFISEIVIPGWVPDQHIFIDEEKVSLRPPFCSGKKASGPELTVGVQLKDMWGGRDGWEVYEKYLKPGPDSD